jgi:galactofuranosylgalactofuranosylrhamnosyl-N-acetylglucosaminyl-diphospho-decaprenol beta-1,5/1,6-galactofuranosyltransferase
VNLSGAAVSALQRVVFPTDRSLADATGGDGAPGAVLPLYVEGAPRPERVVSRTGYRLPDGERVSFCAYFNAFPASYWQHRTDVEQVRLTVELAGAATVEVFRSDADGHAARIAARRTTGDDTTLHVDVPLTSLGDGGWLWFDATAHDGDAELRSAQWSADGPSAGTIPAGASRISVGITTYNRVDSCLGVLRQLGDDPALLEVVDAVYVVDQGDDTISASPRFADSTAALGDRLTVIEQPNLGGSGGFARCQLETLRAASSDHLVILDDDVVLETESLRRAAAFAARCTVPTLVGAQMFSLPEPTRLYAMAEWVDVRRFFWGPKRDEHTQHDLAVRGLRDTAWMHRREDVNYNGWWMCLIPRQVLDNVGLSLPFFIRWDDAEYGLRAGAAGFPTVTLPGVGVWHVPWTHKTDALDWQAYFHQRNRIVSALLHSPHEHGGLLVPELLAHQVKQLASMQYSTAELRLRAIVDVLDGPQALHASLATKPGEARALRAGFPDADVRAGTESFPSAGRSAPDARRRTPRWITAVAGVVRQAMPVRPESRRIPQVHLPAGEAHWSQLVKYDSAVVSTADGAGAVWYRRDRAMFAGIARRSLQLHRRLHREWPRLAVTYRDALADLASPAAWCDTFESVKRG